MRTDVLTVRPFDSIIDLAQMMTGQKPKFILWLMTKKLIGTISRRTTASTYSYTGIQSGWLVTGSVRVK